MTPLTLQNILCDHVQAVLDIPINKPAANASLKPQTCGSLYFESTSDLIPGNLTLRHEGQLAIAVTLSERRFTPEELETQASNALLDLFASWSANRTIQDGDDVATFVYGEVSGYSLTFEDYGPLVSVQFSIVMQY